MVGKHYVFEKTKVEIRNRKSQKDRQHNSQKEKVKRTNNDIKHYTYSNILSSENPTKIRE